MAYAKHAQCFLVEFEADAMIADTEPVLGRIDTLEFFDLPGPVSANRSTAFFTRRAMPLSRSAISSSALPVHSISTRQSPSRRMASP